MVRHFGVLLLLFSIQLPFERFLPRVSCAFVQRCPQYRGDNTKRSSQTGRCVSAHGRSKRRPAAWKVGGGIPAGTPHKDSLDV
eukprot:3971680-Amphidinium_carterae.1